MPLSIKPDLQRFLHRLTIRSVLSEQEKQVILDLPGKSQHVQANRDFVCLGQRTEYACLIVAGLVGRFGQNSDGKRQITAIHIPGDMPDLHSVVLPNATSAFQALSVATIIQVPHSALRSATNAHPALAEAFWRHCMVDAAILAQWVVNVGRRNAKTRLSHLLCEMGTRLNADCATGESFFSFAVTQDQLADATGLTAVHVNRTLQTLRRERLADVSGRTVRVPNWAALAAAGEFEPGYLQENLRPEERLRII